MTVGERNRKIVELYDRGLSTKEITEELSLTATMVNNTLYRYKNHLRIDFESKKPFIRRQYKTMPINHGIVVPWLRLDDYVTMDEAVHLRNISKMGDVLLIESSRRNGTDIDRDSLTEAVIVNKSRYFAVMKDSTGTVRCVQWTDLVRAMKAWQSESEEKN